MWTGCVQSPVRLVRSQCSTLFCLTAKRKVLQSMNWPLIDHWPFKRSNLKVRTTLAVSVVVGSAKNVGFVAGFTLLSATTGPVTRNCNSRSPAPAGLMAGWLVLTDTMLLLHSVVPVSWPVFGDS